MSFTIINIIIFNQYFQGVAFLNGINLGRYWPKVGPQVTLYVPGTFLKSPPSVNTLVMFELEEAPQDLTISFIDKHILNRNSRIFPLGRFQYIFLCFILVYLI